MRSAIILHTPTIFAAASIRRVAKLCCDVCVVTPSCGGRGYPEVKKWAFCAGAENDRLNAFETAAHADFSSAGCLI
jgi:hypothetical protein